MLSDPPETLKPPLVLRRGFTAIGLPAGRAVVAVLGWACALLVGTVVAQDPPSAKIDNTAANQSPPTQSKTVDEDIVVPPQIKRLSGQFQYAGPDTYILLDAEGRPQPVPGMTYEDFLKAWQQKEHHNASDRQPRFTIESVEIDGHARENHADLQLSATIELLTDGLTNVPLGLVGAILQGQPRFDIPAANETTKDDDTPEAGQTKRAEAQLTYDPDRGGFVVRFDGRAGERLRVSLKLIVPLQRDGGETTLPLNCPRAVSSKLLLTVGSAITEATVNNGVVVAQNPIAEGGTRLEIAGVSGQFRLTWQAKVSGGPELASVLSAVGAVRVSIDGHSVRSDARLTVRSYGGSFDRFRVRLPVGAQLVRETPTTAATQAPAYRASLESNPTKTTTPANGDVDRQVVLVELPTKQKGPIAIELSTEQPIKLESGDAAVELAGFEVIGAVRQFGDVALEVAEDWQARWDNGPFVRQVEPNQIDQSLQRPDMTAAFQYDRQPWSLGVRVTARKLRVHATPQFTLECLPDESRLTVHVNYQLFGAPAFEFRVRLKGWKLSGNPVESGGLIDQDGIFVTSDDVLVLPLAQSSSRRAEITLSLRRGTPSDQPRLELPLPIPLADSIGTGELVVNAAPDIDLLPDLQNSTGLSPTPVGEETVTTTSGAEPQFRFRSLVPDAVLAADRIARKREVSSVIVAQADVSGSTIKIEERIDYIVKHEPIKELAFKVPAELQLSPMNVEIMAIPATGGDDEGSGQHETPLNFGSGVEENASKDIDDDRVVRVALPQPRLGQVGIRIRYQVSRPPDAIPRGAWQLPLIEPLDGETTSEHVTVSAPRRISVALDKSVQQTSWSVSPSTPSGAGDRSNTSFTAARAEHALPLIFHAIDIDPPSATTVDKVWLQTWFAGDRRQDRAVFRLRTAGGQSIVELPPDVDSGEVEVLVDGRPAEVAASATGRIAVQLSPMPAIGSEERDHVAAEHTLELRYRRSSGDNVVTRYRFTPPQVDGTTALSQVYWQIVLPKDRHIIRAPQQLTSASQWQWLGSFWGRRPVKSQVELEEWIAASNQLAPTSEQNEYLFTGLAPVSSIELIIAPRWIIVLISSAAVLGLVIAWVYVPNVRRSWIVAAVACFIVALSITYPTAALLTAQASVLGIALAILALLLSRFASRRPLTPVPLTMGSSLRMVTPRAESIVMPPVVAGASTAPTVSLRVSDSAL